MCCETLTSLQVVSSYIPRTAYKLKEMCYHLVKDDVLLLSLKYFVNVRT